MLRRLILGTRNAGLLLICYGYSLMRGSARTTVVAPKKVIVLAASKLGDMVCATPIFRAIKQAYPKCAVVVMGTKPYESLHHDNPDIAAYLVVEEKVPFWSTVKKIRDEHADVVFITGPSFLASAQCFLAGVPLIVGPNVVGGFSPYQTKPYRLLWPLIITKPHHMHQYAPREYLRLLEVIGIETQDTAKHVYLSAETKLFAAQFYKNIAFDTEREFVVGVVPGAGNEIKQWSPKKFAETIAYLREKYKAKIVVFGSGKDTEVVDEVFKYLPASGDVVNTYNMFSIEQLKAVVARLHLCVAVDTGIVYIAEAFGVPTVDIVGPVDEREQPPIRLLNRIVVLPQPRIPQLFVMNARTYDYTEAKRQIDDITPSMVYKEVDAVIVEMKNTVI